MYAAEHEMSLQMEGLTKPRRKRGRPSKAQTEAESLVCNELHWLLLLYLYYNFLICMFFLKDKRECGSCESR